MDSALFLSLPSLPRCAILPRMMISPDASQEQLENMLRRELRSGLRAVVLTGVLLSPFCYLRCLLNPLWVLGLKVPGIFVTALFTCYVGWQYVSGRPTAGEDALLWWAVWAGFMLIIHYCLFAASPIRLYLNSRKFQAATTNDQGEIRPCQHPLKLHKNQQGYQQALVNFRAEKKGIYVLRWELTGYRGQFRLNTSQDIAQPALSQYTADDEGCTFTEFYRLEEGTHLLSLELEDRNSPPPSTATLTQLGG